MIFVLRLGKYICLPILAEWLHATDFVRFDAALCVPDRSFCYELVKKYGHVFTVSLLNQDCSFPLPFVAWASNRNIHGLSVYVSNTHLLRQNDCNWGIIRKFFCSRIKAIHGPDLCHILSRCPMLEDIAIHDFEEINDCVIQLAETCSRLKVVTLGNCPNLADASFVALCRGCPKLESLKLWRSLLLSESIFAMIVHCRRLTYLGINVNNDQDCQMMCLHSSHHWKYVDFLCQASDFSFKTFLSYRGSKLTKIDFSNPFSHELLLYCPHLTSLDLPLECSVFVCSLNIMLQLAHLRELELTCSSGDLRIDVTAAVPVLTRLQKVTLRFRSVLQFQLVLKHCASVRKLTLQWADVVEVQDQEYLSNLVYDLDVLSRLESLDLVLIAVNNSSVQTLTSLTTLRLEECNITDNALETIALNCPGLTDIDLNGCWSVSDGELCKFISHCTALEVLAVSNCCVTGSILKSLLQHRCRSIKEIALFDNLVEYCHETLEGLLRNARKLVRLQVSLFKFSSSADELSLVTKHLSEKYPDVFLDVVSSDLFLYCSAKSIMPS